MKTYMANSQTVNHKWYVVDATGLTLGRLATQVASVLRGKTRAQAGRYPRRSRNGLRAVGRISA